MKIDINNFTFKNYKILKTHNNFNNKFLIIANNNINIKDKLKRKILNTRKITNRSFLITIQKSIFKKFKKCINGSIYLYFFCNKNFVGTKAVFLNKKNLTRLNVLVFKLNNKIYTIKKFETSNFFTYQENIIALFQLNNTRLKTILK